MYTHSVLAELMLLTAQSRFCIEMSCRSCAPLRIAIVCTLFAVRAYSFCFMYMTYHTFCNFFASMQSLVVLSFSCLMLLQQLSNLSVLEPFR